MVVGVGVGKEEPFTRLMGVQASAVAMEISGGTFSKAKTRSA